MSSLYPKNNVTDVLQAPVTMTHKTLHQELMFPVITTKLNAVLKDYKSHMLTSVFCIFFLHKAVDERERERERERDCQQLKYAFCLTVIVLL